MTEVETQSTKTARRKSVLWHNPDFLKFWTGETLSLFGTQVTTLALPLTAVREFQAGAADLGLLGFVQWFPYVLLAMLFGVWVDRSRRRPLMIGANLVRMVLIAAVPVLAALHRLDFAELVCVAAGVGVGSVLFDVSWMSYVPTLVRDKENLVEANSKLGATSAAATSGGPGVGGLLVTALTAPIAMAVDAGSYFVSLLTLLWIRVPEPAPPPAKARRLVPELAEGLRWVVGDRYLRAMAVIGGLCNFLTNASATLFLLYALHDKGLPAAVIGLILSLGATGGIAGAVVSSRVLARLGIGRTYTVSMSVMFFGVALIPLAGGPRALVTVLFVLGYFLAYFGVSVANVVVVSVRLTVTPHAMLGRMNAAMRTLLYAGAAFGTLGAGLVGSLFGVHTGLLVIATGAALMIVAVMRSSVGGLKEMPAAVE